jgi:hypothetical protein
VLTHEVRRRGHLRRGLLVPAKTAPNVSHPDVYFCFLVFQTNEGSLKNVRVKKWFGHETAL